MAKSMVNKKATRLLWVDLEMTGLDASKDRILEVAAIVTDWDFNELGMYEAVIHQPNRILRGMDEWNTNQHGSSGLVERVKKSELSEKQAEQALLDFIDQHFPADEPALLAGNSIHMDRRFIVSRWPKLDKRLHYRMLDVSAWKVVFEAKFRTKFAKPEQHRALEDIRGSISELQYYLKKLNK